VNNVHPTAICRLALALLAVTLLAAPAAAGDSRQQFGPWLGDCRPDGYCSIVAHPTDAAGADDVFRIARHPQQTYWEISLSTIGLLADGNLPFSVAVDGKPLQRFLPPAEVAAFGTSRDFFLMGKGALGLLDRFVKSSAVTIDFTDRGGNGRSDTFSLEGLPAALIWIDTAQHRIGAERVAEAPPDGLSPAGAPGADWMAPALAAFQ
jgi:hypothetical protein